VSTGRVQRAVRTQWLVLAAALVVLAGVLVAWAVGNAADRVQVVQVVRAVPSGHTLTADDLALTAVAYDGEVQGLVPARSIDALVGRVAAIDLRAGALLQVGMWRDGDGLAAGEQSVGAVLKDGRYPSGIADGDLALAAPIDDPAFVPVAVRVIDTHTTSGGAFVVTLAVPQADAVAVAQLAATDRLVLVGQAAGGDA
jgi:hypothetical protein